MAGRGRSTNEPTAPKRVRNIEKMQEAARLRAAGMTFRQIGEVMSCDHTWARSLVIKALEQAAYEAADLMRVQEGQRLDAMQRAHWANALRGDIQATRAVLRIMDQRARLFGLNAPTKVEVTTEVDAELSRLAAALAADPAA